MSSCSLLRLLQFADSALPIGAAAHSFGLDTLASEGVLTPENLQDFLDDWLEESGAQEMIVKGGFTAWSVMGDAAAGDLQADVRVIWRRYRANSRDVRVPCGAGGGD
jgi:urease accessory protein UreF